MTFFDDERHSDERHFVDHFPEQGEGFESDLLEPLCRFDSDVSSLHVCCI